MVKSMQFFIDGASDQIWYCKLRINRVAAAAAAVHEPAGGTE
jgi:hypothetical protein